MNIMNASMTISVGEISFPLPVNILIAVQHKNDQIKPCVIEYVSGIRIKAKNAGIT